jgi:hypothetical protein
VHPRFKEMSPSSPPPSSSSSSSSVTSQPLIGLFPPRLIVSAKVFPVVSLHSVYNSAQFLPSCCCPFLLHVGDNWICIFFVSRQLVLFSALPKYFRSFCAQKGCTGCSSEKFYLDWCQPNFILFSEDPNFDSKSKKVVSQCIIYFYSWKFLDQRCFKSDVWNSKMLSFLELGVCFTEGR